MKFGIGITTRNRPHVLQAALAHFSAYPVDNARIVIIDDASDLHSPSWAIVNSFSKTTSMEVVHKTATSRLGITGAKNACLARLADCEHVFLFDDDAWPTAQNWAEKWVAINEANHVGHSMFNVASQPLLKRNLAFRASVSMVGKIGRHATAMVEFNNCFGVMLYFNRACLNAIGGYDISAPHVYGYEHAQVSMRANMAGFTQKKKYLTPACANELIYSVDISYCMLGLLPPLDVNWLSGFTSSVSVDESLQANMNSLLLHNPPIHIPLVDPLK